MLVPTMFARCCALIGAAVMLLHAGCVHTPTAEDREKAKGRYDVGLSLVHEARRAGTSGDRAQQDLKWRQSLAELLEAEKLDNENPDIQYLLGMVYFVGFHQIDQARVHLERALQLKNNDYPEADQLLGTMLVEVGEVEAGIVHLERARGNLLYPTPYFAEQELGWAKFKLHRYDEAAQHLNAAIATQPDLCGAYVRLADVEEAREDYARASEVLQDFLGRCDSERLRDACGPKLLAYGYYRLAMSDLKRGEKDGAKQSLQVCTDRFKAEPVAKECRKSLELLQ